MEIIKYNQMPLQEIMNISKAFYESGMFQDTKSAAQAIVKIQAGQEMGITPFAAMSGISIILGRPTIGAGIIASKVKGSGKYDYKVKEHTDQVCSIDFYQGPECIGNSTFTIEDAKRAQTKNLEKFPKNMLFARAMSNGQKWFCPDVFLCAVYTPEEMEGVTVQDTTAEQMPTPPNTEGLNPTITESPVKQVAAESITNQLKKCKTKADIVTLYNNYHATVDADVKLQEAFKAKQTELSTAKKMEAA